MYYVLYYTVCHVTSFEENAVKTQVMQFRVSDEEKALIEKCAKKAGRSVSDYIRVSMLMEMVIDGEPSAFKILLKSLGAGAMEAIKERLRFGESSGEEKL